MVHQLVAMIKLVDFVVPEQIIAVPKIFCPSRFPRTVLCEPQKAEQLVEVPVPVPSFGDWDRWEETHRRTGHTWLGGFEWRLIASPGRYINAGPGPRRRPWYRTASVPVHRQSGGDPWLQLARQVHSANCAVRLFLGQKFAALMAAMMGAATCLAASQAAKKLAAIPGRLVSGLRWKSR